MDTERLHRRSRRVLLAAGGVLGCAVSLLGAPPAAPELCGDEVAAPRVATSASAAPASAPVPAAVVAAPPVASAAHGAAPATAYTAFGSEIIADRGLDQLGWSEAEIEAFVVGVRAALRGRPVAPDAAARQLSAETAARVRALQARAAAPPPARDERLQQYLRETRRRIGLEETESGLCFLFKVSGSGVRPRPQDTVVLSVVATAPDGVTKLPKLTGDRARVQLSQLLPGLAEGLQMMTIESEALFVLPPDLSFGSGPWPEGLSPGMPLVFHVTLHEVIPGPATP